MSSGGRLWAAIKELGHAYVDLFGRPLQVLLPRPTTFWRLDNERRGAPRLVKDTKPLGYFLGKGLAYLVLLATVVWSLKTALPGESL